MLKDHSKYISVVNTVQANKAYLSYRLFIQYRNPIESYCSKYQNVQDISDDAENHKLVT